ncbi:acyl-CoA reductase-like NAD-dependent aldehyde dehydrogenase [Ochrobactrum intermedium]|uniref:Acyl-CoA reductase-like NAD-dependent aldehyde dehydrogenase n=1 Tax=Brucella intermedia TaxID=94625 RepID=A0ABR6ANR9_9HYPH|nr:aldehyde dehydrogenase family protein [Brucella intermedia]KAB2709793.1 aldehyde dehydrogenase family protein [Brucella intermedia]MBA8851107.1 acyl-CoA reductase-like NAD-dependent aldehyde dehydrogenase [Brucella intermedia]NYD83566.1 acyl-CoA reductase-like NAD-dependent aldehyde dehydrogenase [Brucella intermedia]UXO85738.1 aldehyde dehydrogenase family protein [Brucella intermedia]WGJ09531.1 aldehyde dehydrogenase family protein [Brucella intermedia]
MSGTAKIISPIDGSVYAERPFLNETAIASAVAAARDAQAEWVQLSIAERTRYCRSALDALAGMQDEIVPEIAWQMGRPTRYGGENGGVQERGQYMIDIAEQSLKAYVPAQKDGFRRYVKHVPLGVVMVIAPWNYPYLTAVNTIIPALMAGNAVILKHATQTLLAGERFAKAFEKAGLPKGVFQNVVLDHASTEKLLASGAIDHVNFTGSVGGGRAIERAAAGTFMTLGLELGGKDPAYVLPDVNLDHAVANLVDGAFFNSGQCCCGIERIYVHEAIYDRFVDGFIDLTKQYVVGNPLDGSTTLGPMAQARFADLIREQKAEALRKGAKAHIDMSVENDRAGSPYVAPEVLTNVDHQMSVMREESFGPIVGIMKVRNDEEALALMNDSIYGLTASLWTADTDHAAALGDRIETGTVFMNRCDYLDPALVWTGVKDTGKGAALSPIGYGNLTRPKSFHLREKI